MNPVAIRLKHVPMRNARTPAEVQAILARAVSIRDRTGIRQVTIARAFGVSQGCLRSMEFNARSSRPLSGVQPVQRRYARLLFLLERHLEIPHEDRYALPGERNTRRRG